VVFGGEGIRDSCWHCFFKLAKKHLHGWPLRISPAVSFAFALHSLYIIAVKSSPWRHMEASLVSNLKLHLSLPLADVPAVNPNAVDHTVGCSCERCVTSVLQTIKPSQRIHCNCCSGGRGCHSCCCLLP
jgi:hypothetical protein